MKTKVLYHSKSGNTKKIADAIAKVTGQASEAIPPAYPLENVEVLFLGAPIRAGKVDTKVEEFIRTLNSSRVKNIVLFSTAGSPQGAVPAMKKLLEGKGINILEESFVTKGKWFIFFDRNRPNDTDIKAAEEFTKKVLQKLGDK